MLAITIGPRWPCSPSALVPPPPPPPALPTGTENAGERTPEQPNSGQQRFGEKRKHHIRIFGVKNNEIRVRVAGLVKFPRKK